MIAIGDLVSRELDNINYTGTVVSLNEDRSMASICYHDDDKIEENIPVDELTCDLYKKELKKENNNNTVATIISMDIDNNIPTISSGMIEATFDSPEKFANCRGQSKDDLMSFRNRKNIISEVKRSLSFDSFSNFDTSSIYERSETHLRFQPLIGKCESCLKLCVFRCYRCGISYYCSRKCQRICWKRHQLKCKPSTFTPLFSNTEKKAKFIDSRTDTEQTHLSNRQQKNISVSFTGDGKCTPPEYADSGGAIDLIDLSFSTPIRKRTGLSIEKPSCVTNSESLATDDNCCQEKPSEKASGGLPDEFPTSGSILSLLEMLGFVESDINMRSRVREALIAFGDVNRAAEWFLSGATTPLPNPPPRLNQMPKSNSHPTLNTHKESSTMTPQSSPKSELSNSKAELFDDSLPSAPIASVEKTATERGVSRQKRRNSKKSPATIQKNREEEATLAEKRRVFSSLSSTFEQYRTDDAFQGYGWGVDETGECYVKTAADVCLEPILNRNTSEQHFGSSDVEYDNNSDDGVNAIVPEMMLPLSTETDGTSNYYEDNTNINDSIYGNDYQGHIEESKVSPPYEDDNQKYPPVDWSTSDSSCDGRTRAGTSESLDICLLKEERKICNRPCMVVVLQRSLDDYTIAIQIAPLVPYQKQHIYESSVVPSVGDNLAVETNDRYTSVTHTIRLASGDVLGLFRIHVPDGSALLKEDLGRERALVLLNMIQEQCITYTPVSMKSDLTSRMLCYRVVGKRGVVYGESEGEPLPDIYNNLKYCKKYPTNRGNDDYDDDDDDMKVNVSSHGDEDIPPLIHVDRAESLANDNTTTAATTTVVDEDTDANVAIALELVELLGVDFDRAMAVVRAFDGDLERSADWILSSSPDTPVPVISSASRRGATVVPFSNPISRHLNPV